MDVGNLQQVFPELEVILENSGVYTPAFYHNIDALQVYDPETEEWKKFHHEAAVQFYPAKDFNNIEGTLRAFQLSSEVWNIVLVYNTDQQLVSLCRWRGIRGDHISMIEV